MATPSTPAPLTPDETSRLVDFARACKAACRIVSLYPPSHPAIRAALDRVEQAGTAVTREAPYTITVMPDTLLVGGQPPLKPDAAVGDLASLLRDHLVDGLTLAGPMATETWHTFLLLLSRPPEDMRAEGGLARAWQNAGGGPIEIRQIDYGEVLRERSRGLDAEWDRRIATYLDDESLEFDDELLAALQEVADDPARLGDLAERVLGEGDDTGVPADMRTALLVRMLQALADFVARSAPELLDRILRHIAAVTPRLPPDTVLALASTGIGGGGSARDGGGVDLAGALRARIDQPIAARFIAASVERGHGATARLAEVFEILVPDETQRHRVLEMAVHVAAATPFGRDPGFPNLWENASQMLASYSDEDFVSEEYDRELSMARARALDVERIADDPPPRVSAWVATVDDDQVRRLDQQLLRDLLRIETRPPAWEQVLEVALTRIDRHVVDGNVALGQELLDTLVEIRDQDGSPFRAQAADGMTRLLADTLVSHVVEFVRQTDDLELAQVARFCRTLGPPIMRPLAEALAGEDNSRAVRRLREVLLSFGPAGRAYADELRTSANPNVRRTAVDLLRAFGGAEALPDLLSLLDDDEPQVQREALRAIIQIGTDEAIMALRDALTAPSSRARDAILQSMSSLRDERAAPLFAHILNEGAYRGAREASYRSAIDALGSMGTADGGAIDALKRVLYRGEWWAPRRTGRLRRAAAAALHACGSPAADAILTEAGARGSRGVRRAVLAALSDPVPGARRFQ